MNYGERLMQLRKSRDLKQAELAELLGVSKSALGTYERVERQPTFELLHKYAKFFNVSIDYLLCHSDEKLTLDQYQKLTTLELVDTLSKHDITLDGKQLTEVDKQRLLDIARVLLFQH